MSITKGLSIDSQAPLFLKDAAIILTSGEFRKAIVQRDLGSLVLFCSHTETQSYVKIHSSVVSNECFKWEGGSEREQEGGRDFLKIFL